MSDVGMPDALATAIGLVPALTLIVAGFAKIGRVDAVERNFSALGLGRVARPAAVAIPPIELVVGVGVIAVPTLGGPLAALMFAAFTVVLARTIRDGDPVACGCFGSGDDRPVAGRDVVRNLVLVAASLLAAGGDGPAWPGVAELVLVATITLTIVLLGTLWDLRRTTGWIWAPPTPVRVPGSTTGTRS